MPTLPNPTKPSRKAVVVSYRVWLVLREMAHRREWSIGDMVACLLNFYEGGVDDYHPALDRSRK